MNFVVLEYRLWAYTGVKPGLIVPKVSSIFISLKNLWDFYARTGSFLLRHQINNVLVSVCVTHSNKRHFCITVYNQIDDTLLFVLFV